MFNKGIFGGAPGVEAVHTDGGIKTNDSNSYTFSSKSIGDAGAHRMVVVAGEIRISNLASPSKPSVTIDGGAATVVYQTTPFIGSFVAYRKVSSGATANIVVTRGSSDNPTQCGIAVFALNTTTSTTFDTAKASANSGNFSGSLTVEKGGVIIYAYNQYGTGGSSAAWSGAESANNAVNATAESTRRTFGQVDIEEDSTSTLSFTAGNGATFAAASFVY